MKKHVWHTVNREYHLPEELTVDDVAAELTCAMMALPEESFIEFVKLIDRGEYAKAAIYFEDGMNRLDSEP